MKASPNQSKAGSGLKLANHKKVNKFNERPEESEVHPHSIRGSFPIIEIKGLQLNFTSSLLHELWKMT